MLIILAVVSGALLAACAAGPVPATSAPTEHTVNLPLAAASAPTSMPTSMPTAAPTSTPTETPTAVPTATPAPSPTPEPQVAGYAGYTVADGDTLESIAAKSGSTPEMIRQYNALSGEPAVGRALIVPEVAGKTGTLESEPILVERGRSDQPWVALTLDAGASAAPVPQILKTLREHNVKITFFLTGQFIKDNPDLVRQIVADGHEIGNHSFNHPDFRKIDDATQREELDSTEALMQETSGATTRPFFRPPFGAYNKQVLQTVESEGYLPIYWTFDSLDSVGEPKSPAFLLERITGHLPPEQMRGAIILAHCGSQPTADALPQILDRFTAMGFEVKKLSEVLGT
ncbi:MAG TPA: polysaccharide deacetylase family protein [Roseiflexaceae bacterium]|nr:polysaccharide deacetylase family protein [Roseiflexaceae bacterium]